MINRRLTVAVITVVVLAAATAGFAIFRGTVLQDEQHKSLTPSTWAEVAWPFPLAQLYQFAEKSELDQCHLPKSLHYSGEFSNVDGLLRTWQCAGP